MAYTVWIDSTTLIDLLQGHYNDKIYENIKEDDNIEEVEVTPRGIKIVIGGGGG